MVIFLGVFTALIALGSLVVSQMLTAVFGISNSADALALTAAVFAASESFVVATMLGARYYNRFTRWYYTVSSVCAALLTYLFLASCIYVIPAAITGDAQRELGLSLIALSCVLTLYGLVNARRIVVNPITVAIKHLPDAWHGRRIVFVSDLHLGQVHGPHFAARIAEVIKKQNPDLVCIGGDLFDGTTAPDLAELAAPLSDMESRFGTYFIMGNHEEFGVSDAFIDVLKRLRIELLFDRKIEIEGMQFIGVDYHSTSAQADFDGVLAHIGVDAGKPSILFKHEPRNIPVAQKHGISLQLSGHTHRGQVWPWLYLTRGIYGVFHYGLHALGDTQVYTSSGVGTWGPPLKVGSDPEIVTITFNRAHI